MSTNSKHEIYCDICYNICVDGDNYFQMRLFYTDKDHVIQDLDLCDSCYYEFIRWLEGQNLKWENWLSEN